MPLHPQAEAARQARRAAGTRPLYTMTLAEARAADLADIRAATGTHRAVGAVEEHTLPGPDGAALRVRVYRPRLPAEPASGGPPPALVYFFGGGWVLGCLDTCDGICRALTEAVGCVTVSVGYRLAPEHPFPAAVHDCHAGFLQVVRGAAALGVDPARVAVGGDSAGGNLAAAVSLLARDRGGPLPMHQLLVYPNTDHRADTPSLRAATDPLLFDRRSVRWYWRHYLADPAHGDDPLASPLRAASHAGLPQATVLTAEYDPLRDEGEAYAAALRAAGVAVAARRYPGMPHGFFAMPGRYTQAAAAQRFAARRLAAAFTPPNG